MDISLFSLVKQLTQKEASY